MASLLPPDDASWGSPPLPDWLTRWRAPQANAINECVELFQAGARVVVLDAPTGAGKSAVAEAVRRKLGHKRAIYVATTRQLQDQILADFPYSGVLKGRRNYPTLDFPELHRASGGPRFGDDISCGDCTLRTTFTPVPGCDRCDEDAVPVQALHCAFCHGYAACPYMAAKRVAYASPLLVTNTAYFLTEANGPANLSNENGFVIVDECDIIEQILMNQIEVSISQRRQREMDLGPPKLKTKPESWVEWLIDEAMPKVTAQLQRLDGVLPEIAHDVTKQVKANREIAYYTDLLVRLGVVWREVLDNNAVYDGYAEDKRDAENVIRFRPVRVDKHGQQKLWRHAKQWLCMSATVIDPKEWAESLGLEPDEWAVVKVPMTFPVENRPIHIKPAAEMTWKGREQAWPLMANGIADIVRQFGEDRVLVHTVSYQFTQYVFDKLRREFGYRIFIHGDADGRQAALDGYLDTEGAVLLSPSMERGVDLYGDKCKHLVLCKVPYMSLGDKQVTARLYSPGGQQWYNVAAIRSLVQATGRGVRSETDTADTWILDSSFIALYRKAKVLFPSWWSDAIDWSGGARGLARDLNVVVEPKMVADESGGSSWGA